MNYFVFIAILVLILIYAVSQVIPISGIIVFVVVVGLSTMLDVHFRRKRESKKHLPDKEENS